MAATTSDTSGSNGFLSSLGRIAGLLARAAVAGFLSFFITLAGSAVFAWFFSDPGCQCYAQRMTLAHTNIEASRQLLLGGGILLGVAIFAALCLLKLDRGTLLSVGLATTFALLTFKGYDPIIRPGPDQLTYASIPFHQIVPHEFTDLAWTYFAPLLTWKFVFSVLAFVIGLLVGWAVERALKERGRAAPVQEA